MFKQKVFHISCYVFVFALFLIITAPTLFTEGMHLDSVIYATISRNMAEGYGSFWNPYFSETLFHDFHEHPALAMWLQSFWFRLLGDSVYVERFFAFTTFIITGILIIAIWKELAGTWRTGWLPVILWSIVPLVPWAYSNNTLENTMGIFVVLSVLFYMKSQKRHQFVFVVLAGFSLSLALLTKGFTGLFPWSFPLLFWLFMRQKNFASMVTDTLVLVGATLVPVLLLFLFNPVAADSMTTYFNHQVVGSFQTIKTVNSRFDIVVTYLLDMIVPLGVTTFFIVAARYRKKKLPSLKPNYKTSLLFFTLSLAGVLPIMVSLKQHKFYILTAFPFMAIAMAILIYPLMKELLENISKNAKAVTLFSIISLSLLSAGTIMSCSMAGKVKKDPDRIHDTHVIIKEVGAHNIINMNREMRADWSIKAYLARYGHISLEYIDLKEYPYLLTEKGSEWRGLEGNYVKLELGTVRYDLYKKKSTADAN